jgi:hypothetical protein
VWAPNLVCKPREEKYLAPAGNRSPAVSPSLYRLSYPGIWLEGLENTTKTFILTFYKSYLKLNVAKRTIIEHLVRSAFHTAGIQQQNVIPLNAIATAEIRKCMILGYSCAWSVQRSDLCCISTGFAHELSSTSTKQMKQRACSDSSNSTWKVTGSSPVTVLTNLEPSSMSTSFGQLKWFN